MSNVRITQQQLESYLWGAAVLLRGTIDAGDYKQFIFPLLFFKRLCDVFDEETVTALRDSDGDQDFALFPENHRFQVPASAHWREIRKINRDVGSILQQAMRAIEVANQDKLVGIFGDAQWTNKDRLSDSMLRDLIEHFSTLELTVANLPEDELGQGYEYLIKKFADDSGHTAAEFYTNRTVVHLMTEMLDVQPGESVYDPTCGSGGMLLSCITHLRRAGKEWRNVKLFGQELNLMTSSIARMNCFLHGIEDFRIERGDTLAEPKLVEGDRLQRFDVVLANPPYSIKQWNREAFAADPWGRNVFGVPPQGRADYAFQQHILQSLKPKTGRCAVLWPHGVLFRDDEAAVRRKLIEADLIECVVGLGPNLFYNSSMPSCIVICRMAKPKERRGKILFINAVNEVTRERAQSFLTDEHQTHIASAYHSFQNEVGFAKVATVDEIRGNDFSLRMGFYVPLKTGAAVGDANGDGLTAMLTKWSDSRVSVGGALQVILGSDAQSKPQPVQIIQNAVTVLTANFDRSKWARVRFGDVVNKISDRIEEVANSGLFHYIGGEHFDSGAIRFARKGLIEGSTIGPAFHMRFKPGHVLYMSRNPHLRKASMVDFEGICANTSYVCEAVNGRLLQELLPFVMQSDAFWDWGSENKRGSTNPYLNWKDIASFEFDLPPLDQQRRIAEILLVVDEVSEEFGVALQAVQSALACESKSMFSQEGPTDWPNLRMDNICTVQQGQVDPKELPYSQMIHIAPDDIESETGRILETKTAAEDKVISGKYEFGHDAVLYCKIRPYLRKVAFPNFSGICSADIYPVYAKSNMLPEFLFRLLLSEQFTKYAIAHSARSAFPKLNREALFAFRFRVPPIDYQKQFLLRLNCLVATSNDLTRHIEHLRRIQGVITEFTFS
jgi:type I restriction enzyme M protein